MFKRGVILLIFVIILIPALAFFADAYCYTSCIGQEDINVLNQYYSTNNADADVNNDGVVDILDIATVGSLFGVCEGAANYNLKYDLSKKLSCIGVEDVDIWNIFRPDLNNDGQSSVLDSAMISANYGACTPNDDSSIDLSQRYGAQAVGIELFRDRDSDQFGSNSIFDRIKLCYPLPGYQTNNLDCDDDKDYVNPNIGEVCNGLNDNCDPNGLVDENLVRSCGLTRGRCRSGTQTCSNGAWGSCTGNIEPSPENFINGTCFDLSDNDCDGFPDTQDNTDDLHCQELIGNKDSTSRDACNNQQDDDNNGMIDIDDPGCGDNSQFFLPSNLFEDITPFTRQATETINQLAQYCGDDVNEFYNTCRVGNGVTCLGTNYACCDWNTDAVYDGKCYGSYNDQAARTVQKDVFRINDITALEFEGKWYDCDNSQNDCAACDDGSGSWRNSGVALGPEGKTPNFNSFASCQGNSCWIKSGQENIGEYTRLGNIACCGDDSSENVVANTITKGPREKQGEFAACCSNTNSCVDSKGICRTERFKEVSCTDKEDNDCDGLIDCEDPDCGPGGSLDLSCSIEPFCNSRFINGDLVDKTRLIDASGTLHNPDDKQWLTKPKAAGESCTYGEANGQFACSSGQGPSKYNKPGDFVCQGVCDGAGQCVATNCHDCNLLGNLPSGSSGDRFDETAPTSCALYEGKSSVVGKFLDYTCSGSPVITNPETLCTNSIVDKPLDVCNTPFEVCRTVQGQSALCQPVVLDLFKSVFKIWVK